MLIKFFLCARESVNFTPSMDWRYFDEKISLFFSAKSELNDTVKKNCIESASSLCNEPYRNNVTKNPQFGLCLRIVKG